MTTKLWSRADVFDAVDRNIDHAMTCLLHARSRHTEHAFESSAAHLDDALAAIQLAWHAARVLHEIGDDKP